MGLFASSIVRVFVKRIWSAKTHFTQRHPVSDVSVKCLVICLGLSVPAGSALAQSTFQPPEFPRMSEAVDEFGVNLQKGAMVVPYPALTSAGLSRVGSFNLVFPFPSYGRNAPGSGATEQYRGFFPNKDNNYNEMLISLTSVQQGYWALFPSFNGASEEYEFKNGTVYPKSGAVNRLECDTDPEPTKECRYTLKDGTVVYYSRDNSIYRPPTPEQYYYINFKYRILAFKAIKPDGEELIYSYWKMPVGKDADGNTAYTSMLKSVVSSLGWAVMYDYKFNDYSATNVPESMRLGDPDEGTAYIMNRSYGSCAGNETPVLESYFDGGVFKTRYTLTNACTDNNPVGRRTLTYKQIPTGSGTTASKIVTVAGQGSLTLTNTSVVTGAGVRRDFEALLSFQNWNEPDRLFVSKATMGTYVRTYTFSEDTDSTYFYATATNADNKTVQLQTANRSQHTYASTDENGRVTNYGYNSDELLTGIYPPDDNDTLIEYNSRRNVSKITHTPRGDGTVPNNTPMVQLYEYETASCDTTNKFVCDKVKKYTDPKLGVTDFTYYPAHGGVKDETGPADTSGVRPQVRYEYQQFTPMIYGGFFQPKVPTKPVYKLVKESRCMVATSANPASCVGTKDELITTYTYNNDNLLLTAKTVRAGGGTAEETTGQTTTYAYDYYGNVITIDGPGASDDVHMVYDSNNRLWGETGADPDGAGPLPRPVVNHSYDSDGREVQTAYGEDGASSYKSFKKMYYDTTGRLIRVETSQN